jgi:hypothetical protein
MVRPFLTYSVLRLGLFAAVMGVLALAGVRGLANPVIAALIAVLLSYLLLRAPREALAAHWAERVGSHRAGDGGQEAARSVRRPVLDDDSLAEDAAMAEDAPAADAALTAESTVAEEPVVTQKPRPESGHEE